jgi:2-polyprenyl-3-methyl-5-hydroxy-6-metoxy-1,4-benzoquinol methylase
MKVNDIRPDDMIKEYQKLRLEDIGNLINCRDEFIEIPCPACESKHFKFAFQKEGFIFVSCMECETYFINPRPPFSLLEEFYKTSKCIKYWKNIFSNTESERKNQISIPRAKRVIELCEKHDTPTGIFIDVGAGYGTFCEEIKKYGIFKKVVAVEPAKDLADVCRQKNLEVIEEPIEKVTLQQVSVITSFELIAHLFWPKEYLVACHKALSHGGLLIITTPNIRGFDMLTLLDLHHNVAGPNHLNYFHADSLGMLLKTCGFDVVQVLTPGKLDAEIVRKKIITGEYDVKNQPFLKLILVEKWETLGSKFQSFLEDSTLSSHLWVVAKKN